MNSQASVFSTARLTVMKWHPDDADAILDIYSRWEVARWLGAAPRVVQTRAEAARRAEHWAALSDADPTFGAWCVRLTEIGTPIGTVLLIPLPDGTAGEVEVGWHFHPSHWGKGYATEAAEGAIQRGFAAGLPEIFAVVNPDNDRSQAVCRRLGMRHLGRTEQYYGMPVELFVRSRASTATDATGVPGGAPR